VTTDWVRERCLQLPHVTEDVKWENNLVFSIGGKMFAAVHLEPGVTWLSFKCSTEDFAELGERPGCRPAPYLARASWIALEHPDALETQEVERLLKNAHQIVLSKLPKKLQREIAAALGQ
jgi:predicted DNA-binding protein (MmcQ/YjbR family)